jgi:hypothetical protein
MNNLIKADFSQNKRANVKALYLSGGVAGRTINDETYIKYQFARDELRKLWTEVRDYTNQMEERLTFKQFVKLKKLGGANYFNRAKAAQKVSKSRTVLHYAQLIISLESLYYAYSEDAAQAKAALKSKEGEVC